jgi:hypothetical protein
LLRARDELSHSRTAGYLRRVAPFLGEELEEKQHREALTLWMFQELSTTNRTSQERSQNKVRPIAKIVLFITFLQLYGVWLSGSGLRYVCSILTCRETVL